MPHHTLPLSILPTEQLRATANSLGQLAQREVVEYIQDCLGEDYQVGSNHRIRLAGYNKPEGMPFDIVVEREDKCIGIEISFQVTTNSTIERKSGQAAARIKLMHANGHKIAYIIDGAGNFQREAAISNICSHSDCTIAYSPEEFGILSDWIKQELG